MNKLIHLHTQNNVPIILNSILAADMEIINDTCFVFEMTLKLGHLIALRIIIKGEQGFQYILSIDSAIRDISTGQYMQIVPFQITK